jgi:hypothetical protein
VVLLPGYLKYSLEKSLLDFRKKDILQFEVEKVQTVELRSKTINWKIKRDGKSWYFSQPLEALASQSQIDNLLDSLSRLRAKDFLIENKDSQSLKLFGLDKPEFTVILGFPESRELVFWLTRKDDKVIVTNSRTRKIIEVESQTISDLSKEVSDLREKKVAVFNSWEAVALSLKKEAGQISAVKEKVEEKGQEQEKWFLIDSLGKKEPADESKVESALRKLEYLEAAEFVDQPGNLTDYGLGKPVLEIVIKVQPDDKEEKELRLLVGAENTEKGQVVIKNQDWPYLFRVDSAFLREIPEKPEDWKPVENKN